MKVISILYRLELPCQEEDLCDPLGIITPFKVILNLSFNKPISTIRVEIKKIRKSLLGTVCLGPISPLHLAFQVQSYPSLLLLLMMFRLTESFVPPYSTNWTLTAFQNTQDLVPL